MQNRPLFGVVLPEQPQSQALPDVENGEKYPGHYSTPDTQDYSSEYEQPKRVPPFIVAAGVIVGLTALIVVGAIVLVNHNTNSKEQAKLAAKSAPKPEKKQPVDEPEERPPPKRPAPEEPFPASRPAESNSENPLRDLVGAFGCLVCAVLPILFVTLHILLLVWIVRDTRNRSVENGVIWMLCIGAFGVAALLVYLASRPQGLLVPCEHCGNKRLEFVQNCPHCGRKVEGLSAPRRE
jgi:hypothetical protein